MSGGWVGDGGVCLWVQGVVCPGGAPQTPSGHTSPSGHTPTQDTHPDTDPLWTHTHPGHPPGHTSQGCLWVWGTPWTHTPYLDTIPLTPPLPTHTQSTSGRYASYWNFSLLPVPFKPSVNVSTPTSTLGLNKALETEAFYKLELPVMESTIFERPIPIPRRGGYDS